MPKMPNCSRWKRDICEAFGIDEAEMNESMRRQGFYARESGLVRGAPMDLSNAVAVASMVLSRPDEAAAKSVVAVRRGR